MLRGSRFLALDVKEGKIDDEDQGLDKGATIVLVLGMESGRFGNKLRFKNKGKEIKGKQVTIQPIKKKTMPNNGPHTTLKILKPNVGKLEFAVE